MRVLVTGGNGFVGRHLVATLQARGSTVRVLALPDENTAWLERRGIAVHRGDIRDPDALMAPMERVDAVVHLAAMMDVWRPLAEYQAVNAAGTENVCRAALAAGAHRVVHMSSSSVYGVGLGRRADETFPLAPFRDPYPVTKAAGDMLVQRMIAMDGLPAVILRPDQIFGPGDHLHFGRMADRLRARRSVIVGPGDNTMPLVYVTDAIQGILLALDHNRAVGHAYNITSHRALTQRELLYAIARELRAAPPRVHVPYRPLYAAGYAAERAAALTSSHRRPPITRLGVAFFGTDNRYAFDRAKRELGYTPQVAVADGVHLTAAWYRERDAELPVRAAAFGPIAKGGAHVDASPS
jgi:nucleoside-diphosphate-sugar epimerase